MLMTLTWRSLSRRHHYSQRWAVMCANCPSDLESWLHQPCASAVVIVSSSSTQGLAAPSAHYALAFKSQD